jgi:predicted GNAT family acetyltransferase
MSKEADSSAVTDNAAAQRYELQVDGTTAFIAYTRTPGTISFDHTEVPAQLGGQGVGSQLAKGALELARAEGVTVIPRCSFVAEYVKRHPQFADLVSV